MRPAGDHVEPMMIGFKPRELAGFFLTSAGVLVLVLYVLGFVG